MTNQQLAELIEFKGNEVAEFARTCAGSIDFLSESDADDIGEHIRRVVLCELFRAVFAKRLLENNDG